VVLTRTLLQGKRTRWQQSFLLTANKPVEDEDDEKKGNL
jgi:membrane protein